MCFTGPGNQDPDQVASPLWGQPGVYPTPQDCTEQPSDQQSQKGAKPWSSPTSTVSTPQPRPLGSVTARCGAG